MKKYPPGTIGMIEYYFFEYDENTKLDPGDYIVIIANKYDHEEEMNFDINILSVGSYDGIDTLLTDTDEGQQFFEIIAYAPLYVEYRPWFKWFCNEILIKWYLNHEKEKGENDHD